MNSESLMTIVIPAYNEAQRLPDTLARVAAFVESCPQGLDVIVVNNNSRDATREVALDFAERREPSTTKTRSRGNWTEWA